MRESDHVSSPGAAVVHLGCLLRELRRAAGITGTEMSSHIHLSQSAISKLETGKSGLPEWPRIESILEAVRATFEERQQVRRQYELAQLDPNSYVYITAHGVERKQAQLRSLEEDARLIRDFQNSVIPGLLQTTPYAEAVFRGLGSSQESANKAARERSYRQSILNDPRRSFVFVVLDAAFYSIHSSFTDHISQLDFVLSRSASPHVHLHVLDSRMGLPISTANPFMIVDRRFVSAETTIRELATSISIEVAAYESAFRELLEASLDEASSRHYIQAVASELTAKQDDR